MNVSNDLESKFSLLNEQPFLSSEQTSLIFSVKTCNHARIILTNNYTLRPAYIAVIGKQFTNSKIRKCIDIDTACKDLMGRFKDNDTLSCEEFRSFWISWNETIRIGKGDVVGLFPMVISKKSPFFDIQFIGLLTASGSRDRWIFDKAKLSFDINEDLICNETDSSTSITTVLTVQDITKDTTKQTNAGHMGTAVYICTETRTHNLTFPFSYSLLNKQPILISEQTSLVFSVRACKHVRIILAENDTFRRPSLEAIIGKWFTKSRIKQCSDFSCSDSNQMDWVEENDMLSCEEFRTFWLSWNGSVNIGRGNVVGLYPFIISNTSPSFNVQFIGVLTGSGSSDRWTFDKGKLSFEINEDLICNNTETNTSMTTVSAMQSISMETTQHTATGTSTTTVAGKHVISMQTKYDRETIASRTTVSATQSISLATTNYTATSKSTTTISSTQGIPKETTKLTNTGIMVTAPCICPCAKVTEENPFAYLIGLNLSKTELIEELRDHLESLTKEIKIDVKSTSASKRKKISAPDRRASAKTIGYAGVLIITTLLSLILVPDIITFLKKIKRN
ncbi:unnamed protein product [Mytilus coruscus]|uniref:Farnesoic acid O-methyl transferase domain-containing protein n=1 Tax=Mytilus coruscus TaxID=42192 RepID=A0A6J8F4Q6_MYTCO|nr:unnamed protein product [Mytilus coruscus]